MAHPLPQDKRAGFIGLLVSLIAIIATVIVITELTSRSFESHGAAAQHGPAPQAAPAPGAPAQH